ncbi:MAG: hypothetical protein RIS75_1062, partial [Actinomycetota bacterium]
MKLFIEELRERIRQSSLNGFELVVGPQMWTVGYFLWMIVISGVIHAFGAYDAKPDMALERFIAVLASHIPMMLTIYLSLWVSRRFSPFRKLLTVIAGLYIGGAVRGYVLQTLMIYFDASIFDDYAFRVFGSAMNVAILGMALSYLLSITKKWSELFQSLRSAQLQLEELLSQTENEIEQVTNEEISSIKYELVNRISTLKNFKPEILSQQIKNLIDNNVRPLITTYLHAVQQFSSQQVTQPQINFRWMS